MRAQRVRGLGLAVLAVATAWGPRAASADEPVAGRPAARDGQRDFDFLIGKWKYHLSRLENPLSGSTKWLEYEGTGVCRPIWNGDAQIDELDAQGPAGRVQGLTLRLYDPVARQWNLNYATKKSGALGVPPTVGSFDAKNGRGEFYDYELWRGRWIFVRYVWKDITPSSARFEQSFSEDGGRTWEVNWITTQTRIEE